MFAFADNWTAAVPLFTLSLLTEAVPRFTRQLAGMACLGKEEGSSLGTFIQEEIYGVASED